MSKKWFFLIGCVVFTIIGISFIQTITFVPYKKHSALISTINDGQLVALPDHYHMLKRKYPDLIKLLDLKDLRDNQVVILPWKTNHKDLIPIKMNGHSFYDSSKGAIQIKGLSAINDGYHSFLKERVKLTAGGTVVLARGVHKVIAKNRDIHFPWKGTRQFFKNSDINILNFKSPLVSNFSYPKSSWLLIGKTVYANAMVSANIHLVSLAGNHMGDAKAAGLSETIQTLENLNIKTVGAGVGVQSAYQCQIISKKKTKFGFLGFNNVPGSIGKPNNDSVGIAWLDNDAIAAVKACNAKVDQLVVLVNWGIEYTHQPRKKEQKWAKKLVEAGADIVLGDQAHWVQSHQTINGKHVSYGLGNYIFDQHWSQNTTEGIIQTFVFHQKKLITIDTTPVKLQRTGQILPIDTTSSRYWHVLNAYNSKIVENN
ncbi:MAG: CapA family protein [Candidatus Marinamargulisbacteria bacterium]